MSRRRRRTGTLWQDISHHLGIPELVFLALVIGARLALPYVVRYFVNEQLAHIQDFHGHVDKIRINLFRGAYTIVNLRIVKTSGRIFRRPWQVRSLGQRGSR
jgi:hypothetical protein